MGHLDDVWLELTYRHCGVCRILMTESPGVFERPRVKVLVLDYTTGNIEADVLWKQFGFQSI
jgi:hypothetical protein